ncbi:PREDICTED: uncharacterized protein LOC109461830 isoform X5 [Branchiostoma belcheri]|uniref:Uncharacterized protein LOC109461830 isoform X5 n=1 Tax=Branchiostoma belcheri TaxID=7741 RepID=A0A6P4Y588_BRABE|nr:PREDICTED: uncharacterized protein LOC109461830 isoform X5 [Branchiostoma belcheri]
MICHNRLITGIECVNGSGTPYTQTGDVAFCNVTEGFRCLNSENWFLEDEQCDDYKVRFYCSCREDETTVRPPTTSEAVATTTPSGICIDHWTQFFNENTPTHGENGFEIESLHDLKEKYMICYEMLITDIECVNATGTPYYETGDVAFCDVTQGFRCLNSENWFLEDEQCDDYKVRFFCSCPETTTPETTTPEQCDPYWTEFFDESTPTIGLNGQETETLEDLRTKYMICHGQPITDVECVDENGISYRDTGDVASCTTEGGLVCNNHDNWFTEDKQCSNYKVRFQCGCQTTTETPTTTETTTTETPTTTPLCTPYWTDYFDESTPTIGLNGQETETLEDLRTMYMICHGLPITDVECVDENGVSYLDTGDVASCTTEAGLTCLNSENWFTADKQCSNYRVRFLCGCQETTTSQPVTTHPPFSGNVSEVFIHTIMEGFDYTLNMSIKGTEDYMMLEEGVLQMIGMMFDDYLGTGINVSIVSVVNGSVDVTTKLDLYEELIPTAYSRILGNDWLKTVLVDELPPERYAYLLSIDEARRTLDEEHGHEHTLHYAMRNCGDFVPGCVPKELCLTWENETNCRCFTGYVDSHGHICTATPSPPPDGYCEPYWTPFFNTNTTTAGEFGGEMELLENVRQGNYSICDDDYIIDIMCRKVGTNLTADDLGQTVLCNNTMGLSGLRCFNSDNLDTDAGQCEDYEVSYKCGCEIEIVTSVLSSRMVGIEWSVRFTDKNSWEYKLVEEYYMKMTRTMLADIDGIFGMRFLGITPGSIIVSVEINSTRAAVHLLRYRSLELDDDWHFVPDDMTMGNMSIWELMGDQCTSSLHTTCTPVETCFLHHHGEYRCRCHSGFIEIENKTRCIDVDECEVAIDECAMYNKSCTNLPGSHACHCPDGLVWNVTSSSCGEPIVAKWVPIRLNVTDCSDLDCSPGTCEYDTAGTPFCRCPDGTKRNNCHEGLIGDAETGSLAALAALAAIIPCCCCLAILAARKQRKKRKLLLLHSTGVSSHRCSQNDR